MKNTNTTTELYLTRESLERKVFWLTEYGYITMSYAEYLYVKAAGIGHHHGIGIIPDLKIFDMPRRCGRYILKSARIHDDNNGVGYTLEEAEIRRYDIWADELLMTGRHSDIRYSRREAELAYKDKYGRHPEAVRTYDDIMKKWRI